MSVFHLNVEALDLLGSRWTISPTCHPPGHQCRGCRGFLAALGWWRSLMVKLVLEPKSLAGGQQQQLKLSPSTAGLQFPLTAGNNSFSKFPLTGRWKTHFISWRLCCSVCLLRATLALRASSPPPPCFGTDFWFSQCLPRCYHQKGTLVVAEVVPLLWWWFSAPSFPRCEERMLSKDITFLQQNHWGEPNGQFFFSDDFESLRRPWPTSEDKVLNRFTREKQLLPPFCCLLRPLVPHAQQRWAPSAEAKPAHSPERFSQVPPARHPRPMTQTVELHTPSFLCASDLSQVSTSPHRPALLAPKPGTFPLWACKACTLHAQLK